MNQGSLQRRVLFTLLLVAAAFFVAERTYALLAVFSDVILIFFLAWLIAFLLSPAADALERRRLPRGAAVLAVYAVLVVVAGVAAWLLIPVVVEQGRTLQGRLPTDLIDVEAVLGQVQTALVQIGIDVDVAGLSDALEQVWGYLEAMVGDTTTVMAGVFKVLSNLVLVLVISVYMMLEGHRMGDAVERALSSPWREEWVFLRRSVGRSFGGFIRGQAVLAIIYGIGVGIVMLLAGLGYPGITALIAALLAVIPFFGPILGLALPALIALLQAPWYVTLIVVVVLAVFQAIVYQVVSPKLMGESVGLSPLFVLAAMLVAARIAGIWGALFGVPVAAVVYAMVVFSHRQLLVARGELPPEALAEDVEPPELAQPGGRFSRPRRSCEGLPPSRITSDNPISSRQIGFWRPPRSLWRR